MYVVCTYQYYDAIVPVVGCDKNMPGAMIALGRLNRPGILVYGGTIKGGKWKGEEKWLNFKLFFLEKRQNDVKKDLIYPIIS